RARGLRRAGRTGRGVAAAPAGDRGRGGVAGMRRGRVAVAALAVAQVAFGLRQGRVHARDRSAGSTRAIVGLMAAAAAVEAVDARGERGPAPLAAAGAVGFAAEVVGVATGRPFGRYSYSDRLGPRVAGVPLLAA